MHPYWNMCSLTFRLRAVNRSPCQTFARLWLFGVLTLLILWSLAHVQSGLLTRSCQCVNHLLACDYGEADSTNTIVFKAIKQALMLKGVTKDRDVEELCLSGRKLNEIPDLHRFRFLTKLWLNNNKLRRVNCLGLNFRLRELYLHDNHLNDIEGSLRHLTCLEVLALQNNYLTDLVKVMGELERMQALKVLNLFDNPLALEPDYRLFVINSVPSLTHLDQSEVKKSEQNTAMRIYHQSRQQVKDKIAFGRSIGPPCLYCSVRPRKSVTRPETAANNYVKIIPRFENLEDAATARQLTKSLTLYSMLDWSTVPRSEDRRQTFAQFRLPSFITHVYR